VSWKEQECGLSRLPTNAESEFAFLSAAFITCAYVVGTNRAGLRKTPVTLRDNTNEGSDVRGHTVSTVPDSKTRQIFLEGYFH
jgi:hypothetical protein